MPDAPAFAADHHDDAFGRVLGSDRGSDWAPPAPHPPCPGLLPPAAQLTYTPFSRCPEGLHSQLDSQLVWEGGEFNLDMWAPQDPGWPDRNPNKDDIVRAAIRAWWAGSVFVTDEAFGGRTRDIILPHPVDNAGLREAVRRAYAVLTGRDDADELRFAGELGDF